MLKYNITLLLGWLITPLIAISRLTTGKDSLRSFLTRFALGKTTRPATRPIWFHVASIGELNTLETLLPQISNTFPTAEFLITVSNTNAHEQAKSLIGPRFHLAIAPLDFRSVVKRFLNKWNPIALITIENEIYPNRNTMCRNAGMPIIWINARISKKSFAFWKRNPRLTRKVIDCIDYVFAQDSVAHQRFLDLGVRQAKIELIPNLKMFKKNPVVDHSDLTVLQQVFPRDKTICAASTHKNEDAVLLAALKIAHQEFPDLKMILAPRHPKRAREIMALMEQSNMSYATRSKGELPQKSDSIYLVDTLGEMDMWYSASAVTYVAGSITKVGGHTPFEPASYGSALIHGPHYSNFQNIYETLLANGGSRQADTPQTIKDCWFELNNQETRGKQILAANAVLFGSQDAEKTIRQILDKTAEIVTALPVD